MSISTVSQSLNPDAPIFLYRLDATKAGGSIYYFVQALQTDGNPITFGGQAYTPVDIKTEGFEANAGGSLPQPKLTIANSDENLLIQSLLNAYGDLAGSEVRRVRTFARFLDGGAEADPTVYIGPDIFRIERKSDENKLTIEWELSAAIDQEGKMLPGRQFLRDICTRRYRRYDPTNIAAHPDGFVYPTIFPCPYTGVASFDPDDNTSVASNDRCGRRVSSCKKRFGDNADLPFGGFPGIARVQQ